MDADTTLAAAKSLNAEHGENRVEHDLLGDAVIPIDALFGVHSARAVENFPISGVPIGHYPTLIRALAMVKKAAARTNNKLGALAYEKAALIDKACDALLSSDSEHSAFVVDAIQGGAGTSTNMNANEVIANLGLKLGGYRPGRYDFLHPNDHVNMSQSTNDAYPTALQIAALEGVQPLQAALKQLSLALKAKGSEFADVIKMGRTPLQDAVPMTLGQEFDAFHVTIRKTVNVSSKSLGSFTRSI